MTNPAPGWYPEAPGSPVQRWWDGYQWTHHTQASVPQPQYMGPTYAVTHQQRRTSHGLHLFLTIVTLGLWGLFVWLPLTLWHKAGPRERIVTKYR
jgi:hypothetical protein